MLGHNQLSKVIYLILCNLARKHKPMNGCNGSSQAFSNANAIIEETHYTNQDDYKILGPELLLDINRQA